MTPTLRKLYHRRGKLLSYLNEIDRQIEELTPQKGDLVCYEYRDEVHLAIVKYSKNDAGFLFAIIDIGYEEISTYLILTVLEKGFEK